MLTMFEITRRLRMLRAGRLHHGRPITQRDVAQAISIPMSRYWEIENGYRKPSPSELTALARVLRCTPDDIVPSDELAAMS